MSFSDLTPQNTIEGGTDGTDIGNTGDALHTVIKNTQTTPAIVSLPDVSYDAAGRLRVSSYYTLVELSGGGYFDTVRYWDTDTIGGGTVTADTNNNPSRVLAVGTASGDEAIIQSRRRIEYNKGHSQLVLLTGHYNTAKTNVRQRVGYFASTHGLFFELDGTTLSVARRSSLTGSVVDTKVSQSSWNVDKLDGTGNSGLTFVTGNSSVFAIDFLWLGVKSARFYIVMGEKLIHVHTMEFSNSLTMPYMDSGMAPIRYEITNTGVAASTSEMHFTCASVKSEGEIQNIGQVRPLDSGITAIAITSTEKVIAGIRINSSYLRGSIKPLAFALLPASGTGYFFFKIIYNPTLTSPTFTAADDGIADVLTNNPTYTGGSIIASGYGQLGNKNSSLSPLDEGVVSDLFLGSDIAGTADSIIIVVRTISGNGSVHANFKYREFF